MSQARRAAAATRCPRVTGTPPVPSHPGVPVWTWPCAALRTRPGPGPHRKHRLPGAWPERRHRYLRAAPRGAQTSGGAAAEPHGCAPRRDPRLVPRRNHTGRRGQNQWHRHARRPCSTRHGNRCASPRGSRQTAVRVGVREARTNRTPRPKCGCDPCRGARRALRGRPGCSSVPGSRASWHAGGCSAGKCASWCLILAAGCSRAKSPRHIHHRPDGPLPGYQGTQRADQRSNGRPPRSVRVPRPTNTADNRARVGAVVRAARNLWKTLALQLFAGIGSANCCQPATSWTTHSAGNTAQEEVSARG